MVASRTGADPGAAAERPGDTRADATRRRGARPAQVAVEGGRPGAVSLAVVAGIFYGLLRETDLAEVGDALAQLTPLELSGLVLVTIWNTVTYWLVLQSALPGLTLPQAAISSTTSTAVANTVPGGAAFGIVTTTAMYASWGFPGPVIARAVVVTGVEHLREAGHARRRPRHPRRHRPGRGRPRHCRLRRRAGPRPGRGCVRPHAAE